MVHPSEKFEIMLPAEKFHFSLDKKLQMKKTYNSCYTERAGVLVKREEDNSIQQHQIIEMKIIQEIEQI